MSNLVMYAVDVWPEIQVRIKPVEVDRYNEKSVWIRGSRTPRMGKITWYFSTYEHAIFHMEKMACEVIEQYKREIFRLEQKMKEIDKEIIFSPT